MNVFGGSAMAPLILVPRPVKGGVRTMTDGMAISRRPRVAAMPGQSDAWAQTGSSWGGR